MRDGMLCVWTVQEVLGSSYQRVKREVVKVMDHDTLMSWTLRGAWAARGKSQNWNYWTE
jgi:hypothetical protein